MAEPLSRSDPVPNEAVEFAGVRISLEPPMARYSLRGYDLAQLETVTGCSLPKRIGDMDSGTLMLGPDEWLMRLPIGAKIPPGEGHPVSIVDVTERQIAIAVEGVHAAEVIQGGNPLDLEHFPIGSGKRTIFEGVEIILIRESETRFIIEVWRSFAEFVWGVLVKSASEV